MVIELIGSELEANGAEGVSEYIEQTIDCGWRCWPAGDR